MNKKFLLLKKQRSDDLFKHTLYSLLYHNTVNASSNIETFSSVFSSSHRELCKYKFMMYLANYALNVVLFTVNNFQI